MPSKRVVVAAYLNLAANEVGFLDGIASWLIYTREPDCYMYRGYIDKNSLEAVLVHQAIRYYISRDVVWV